MEWQNELIAIPPAKREKYLNATGCVDLVPENQDAAQVYMTVRGQVVTAGNGQVIDLDFNAVKTVMDLYGVRDQRDCFEKVRTCFFHFLNEGRE